MFTKTKQSLVTFLTVIIVALLFLVGALSFAPQQTAYAYDSSNIPKGNNVIAIHDGTKFDAVELKTLATTAGYTDLNAMMSAATEGGTAIAETLKGKVVQLGVDRTVGGSALKWAPVYLSRSTDGDAILTLWLATDIYRSSWSDGTYSLEQTQSFKTSNIYSDTYDGSFIRHKLNGKSGWTANWGETNNEANPNEKIGTMVSDFYGNGTLASYVTTPAKVSWQKNTHKMKNDPNWDGSGTLVKGAKANYPCDWLNDNVWLPSMYEVYDSNIPNDYSSYTFTADGGLWGVNKTGDIVSSTDGAWLRSGYPNHCANPCLLVSYGNHSYGNVFRNIGVRPALHLNLSKVADTLPKPFEVTVGNATTGYSTIAAAFTAANSESFATVKMFADATVGETLTVATGKNITLDLNGYKLALSEGASGSVIQVNGMFTLNDSNPEKANTVTYYTSDTATATASIKGGVITGGKNSGVVVGRSHEETANDVTSIIEEFVGIFIMNRGNISGNVTAPGGSGGGVFVSHGSTAYLYGGTISYNYARVHGGGVRLEGATLYIGTKNQESACEISHNIAYKSSGAIDERAVYESTIYMNGGKISYNTALTEVFGGLCVEENTTLTIDKGEISYNSAPSTAANQGNGGGIGVISTKNVTIKNAVIKGNNAGKCGGGLYVGSSTVQMENCTIGGTTDADKNTANLGGGVYINSGTFNMSGGNISGNTATTFGGGVYCFNGTFNISGNPKIKDNKKSQDVLSNISFGIPNKITVNGALGADAEIHINGTGAVVTGFTAANRPQNTKPSAIFKPDNASKCVYVSDETTGTVSIGTHTGGTATCVAAKICTNCGESYGSTDSSNHTPSADDGDCTTAITCNACGTVTTAAQTHDFSGNYVTSSTQHWHVCTHSGCTKTDTKTDHNCNQEVATDTYLKSVATCTAKAVYYKSCVCGFAGTETFENGELAAHTEVDIPAVAATCTETGLTAGKKCSVCQTITVAQQTVEKTEHSYGEWVNEVSATCIATGTAAHKECLLCHKYFDSNNAEIADLTIATNDNHAWNSGEITKQSTCTEAGVKTFTCTRNPAHTKTESVAAKGHTWHDDAEHTNPTCTTEGSSVGICTVCNEHVTQTIPALGHDKVQHEAKAATCTEKGYAVYETCSRCDYTTYSEIAALGHDKVQHEAKAATCTEKGYTVYETCSRCDYTTYSEIAALGHSYGEWAVTKQSTLEEYGEQKRVCSHDDTHVQTKQLPKRIPQLVEPDKNGGEVDEVIVSQEGGLAPDVQLVVTEIEQDSYAPQYETIAESANGVIELVYDVTLKSDGVTVQPDGTLTIKLRIPENLKGKEFKLFHLHEGTATDTQYTVDGAYAVVTTDRLSEFIFVGEKISPAPAPAAFNPLWTILIIIVSLVIVGEVGYIVYRKVRKNKAAEVQE